MFSPKRSPKASKKKDKDDKKKTTSRSRSKGEHDLAKSANAGGAGYQKDILD